MTETITSFVEAVPLPMLVIGPDDRIRASNRASSEILQPVMAGRHYLTVLRQPAVLDAILQVRASAETATCSFRGRDGHRDTTYNVTVARAGQDIVLSFVDQTDAHQAGQMRRDFVANVSHELRTPLTALLGFIETLGGAARNDAAARDRFLGIMAHEANRMRRLVDDLLSLSRLEEEGRRRPRDTVNLRDVLERVSNALQPQAKTAGVAVTLDLPDAPVDIPGDQEQLVQVFTNLLENAIKYGQSGKTVDMALVAAASVPRLRGQAACVTVTDHGEGIDEHHIPRLTERFYRVDSHRSREVGGTGLGLAIVKHIINRHRGVFVVKSKLGEGTRVSVYLPHKAVS